MADEHKNTEVTDNGAEHATDNTVREMNHSTIPVIPQLSVALFILVFMFGISSLAGGERTREIPDADHLATPEITDNEPLPLVQPDPFAGVAVVADSAFVWDVAKQRALYSKDPDLQLPLASITKLMTALVAYELLDETAPIGISQNAVRELGDSGLTDGEQFSFEHLTDLTLIGSSNDGARALAAAAGASISADSDADAIFIEAMNIRAEEIGLSQTYFNNATGLDISQTEAGAYGSARDMTFLMEYIVTHYPSLLDETTVESALIPNEAGDRHLVQNANNAIRDIPGIIASKTGYTDLAGGNLIVVFEAGLNRPIIVTVLGSTYSDRFSDVVLLEERARAAVSQ